MMTVAEMEFLVAQLRDYDDMTVAELIEYLEHEVQAAIEYGE